MISIEAGSTEISNPMVLIENLLSQGAIAASTEASGFDASNAIADSSYDGWQPTAMPATMAVTLPEAGEADCLGIAAHNLGSTGSTVFVEYFDGSWIAAASHTPTDDSAILLLFPAQTATDWRLRVTGATPPTINFVMLGSRIVFQSGITGDYTPTNWGDEVELLGGETRSGQFLGHRVLRRGAQTRVSVGRVTLASFLTGGQAFFRHYNEGRAFFFAGWPAGLPDDVAMCWRGETMQEINPSIQQGDLISLSFNVRCYVPA